MELLLPAEQPNLIMEFFIHKKHPYLFLLILCASYASIPFYSKHKKINIFWNVENSRIGCIISIDFQDYEIAMAASGKFQDYYLKWNNYYSHLSGAFLQLLESESMVDVTLSAGGEKIRAHRIVLSACSPYFQELLATAEDTYPTLILSDVSAEDIRAVLEFVYRGELCIMANRFASVLKVADDLKIRGLSEVSSRLPNLEGMMSAEQTSECMAESNAVSNSSSFPGSSSLSNVNSIPSDSCIQSSDSSEGTRQFNLDNQEESAEKIMEENDASMPETVNLCEVVNSEDISRKDVKEVDTGSDSVMEVNLEREDNVPSLKEEVNSSVEVETKAVTKAPKASLRAVPRYVERCEGVIEIGPRKKMRKQRYRKEYSEEALCEALAELRRGRPLIEAAAAHHIPRSTLYVRARSSGIQLPLIRQEYPGEMINAAVQAVQGGSSLKRASDHFKIPKTVLWRKVQRELENGNPQLKKIEKSSRNPYTAEQRQAAIDALIRGDSIAKVYREYQISKTTLFRERARLIASGRIPPVAQRGEVIMKRGNPNHEKLDLAVTACQKRGMTHALAALTYQVPKTTLWRRLQQLRKKSIETCSEESGEGDVMALSLKKEDGECETVSEVEVKTVEEDKMKDDDKSSEERTQVEDPLEVVMEGEVTVKEDGTVSFVAADGSTECAEGLQFPPDSTLIILTTSLQEGEQIIVETDETEKEILSDN
ncbi:hypothetical protein J437_LFUL009174 [Ladona fulva]|uniref:BTB domain-containing protein n=1 Tax=Ladona fulva TaxID=123851 RepID=A0A8K0JYV5_LADFU|nr:hypothetical protein J437_LFUL009174 [Ladona fulva]